jgi:Transposase
MDQLSYALRVGTVQEDSQTCCAPTWMEFFSWTEFRLSNGAVEGMNNKIKSISHRSFGFRTAANLIAVIYHCCARLPLPAER